MSFAVGVLVGAVVGLAGGVIIARPRGQSADAAEPGGRPRPRRGRSDWGAVAMVVATLALAASGVALVRSDRRQHRSTPSAPAGTTPSTTTTAAVSSASTTTVTAGAGTVAVPNVVGLARATAEASIQGAGLNVSVETLSLSNVPAGFVISQNPLPAALVTPGATVSLVVSGAT